jgi:hypothetical protein
LFLKPLYRLKCLANLIISTPNNSIAVKNKAVI